MPNGLLYDNPGADEWMDSRMEMFRETKKSVLSQEGDFDWIISVDFRTPKKYLDEIADDDRITYAYCDIRSVFRYWVADTPWVITTRLDCDDQLKPGFVKRVQDHFEPKLRVLDVRFEELEWHTKRIHEGERRWAGSMFLSLIEPSDKIQTAFCRPHGEVAGGYPIEGSWDEGWGAKTIIEYYIIEETLAYMVCHGKNIANIIRGKYLRTLNK